MSARVYVGHLSSRATERDIEHFFRGYGRIRDIVLKNGFGFVEFSDSRDADDAIYELNGKDLVGERVVLELSRRGPNDRFDRGDRDRYDDRRGRDGGRDRGASSRFGPPMQTRHRLLVENLSSSVSWQDLKDMMRNAGTEVTYADAHKSRRNEAVVCFQTRSDLKRAIDKFQGKDVNGRDLKLTDDSDRKSRSRSRSPRRSRSRSRSRSPKKSRSRSRSRSRSSSRGKKSASRSRSRSEERDKAMDEDKKSPRSRSSSRD
ncbi:unnamed protein product, partial [Mesorhabditis spiculigera]